MSDLIERSAVIEQLHKHFADEGFHRDKWWNSYHVLSAIVDTPAVDAVPVRHGRWKIKTVREYDLSYGGRIYIPEYVCGCCGHYYESYVRGDEPIMPEDADFPMYCEQCGAKMDGKDDNGRTD